MFADPESRLLLRLRPGVRVAQAGGLLQFVSDDGRACESRVETAPLASALLALAGQGIRWSEPASIAMGGAGSGELRLHVEALRRSGMLDYVWCAGGMERAVITALHPDFQFLRQPLPREAMVALSRFAYARRDGPTFVLESPEALCRLEFTCLDVTHWLGRFGRPVRADTFRWNGQPDLAEFAALLWSTGFLERTDLPEPASRACWEFQDLQFHWRTRAGRVSGPQGGTFRLLGQVSAPPAVKPPMTGTALRLPVPSTTEANTERGTLSTVLEARRSLRNQGEVPITFEQIARLLYFTVRVQQRLPGEYQELLLRPVPAAGAIHEIELYLAVRRCTGLEAGLYHYQPEQHALHLLPAPENHVAALLQDAAEAWAKPDEPPQVLMILATRFPRIGWKYEGIAYRLSLLNAGVIIQSLYLLATEMRLACSALGGGDSGVFAAATGLDPLEETSIAEFAVGSLASEID